MRFQQSAEKKGALPCAVMLQRRPTSPPRPVLRNLQTRHPSTAPSCPVIVHCQALPWTLSPCCSPFAALLQPCCSPVAAPLQSHLPSQPFVPLAAMAYALGFPKDVTERIYSMRDGKNWNGDKYRSTPVGRLFTWPHLRPQYMIEPHSPPQ